MAVTPQPQCVWALGAELGEGPVWSAAEGALWFVDIKKRQVHRHVPGTDGGDTWSMPDQPGFALPAEGGALIVGMPGGLHRFDPASSSLERVLELETDRPGNRLNDAHVDATGRLWFGSMDDAEASGTGALYSWDGRALVRHDDGICITNGPVVSLDGRTLYHTDTLAREIHTFALAPDGSLSGKRLFLKFEDSHGWPDGSTLDSGGCLWVAFFGGWCLRRFAPDGRMLQTVRMPCANVTKLAFGGPQLRTAFVTTAQKGLDAAQLAQQPLAGGLFVFEPPVAGMAQNAFRIRTR